MPLFDFKCKTCEKIVEMLTSSAVEVIICPACGGPCHKQIGASNFKVNGHNASNGYAELPSVAKKPQWSK